MTKNLAWLTAIALAFAVASAADAQTPAMPSGAPVTQTGGAHAGKIAHPHMERAHKALENAKKALEESKHDYDGHRAKAIEHVDAALKEIDEALALDNK